VKEKSKPKLIAPERDPKTIDMFCNLSDAQINKYSAILSKLSELSDLSNFQTILHLPFGLVASYEIRKV
jgi:hypothetical protein